MGYTQVQRAAEPTQDQETPQAQTAAGKLTLMDGGAGAGEDLFSPEAMEQAMARVGAEKTPKDQDPGGGDGEGEDGGEADAGSGEVEAEGGGDEAGGEGAEGGAEQAKTEDAAGGGAKGAQKDVAKDGDKTEPAAAATPGAAPGASTAAAAPAAEGGAGAAAAAPAGGDVARAADGNDISDAAPALVARAASSTGAPLPEKLSRKFGASLGADLSNVRVHTDAPAADAAASVGARAYATGNDVYVGAGQYQPDSAQGEHLLAHEVAHTVQQQGAAPRPQGKLDVSSPGDSAEVEADQAADAMVSRKPAAVTPALGLARKIMRDPTPTPGPTAQAAGAATGLDKGGTSWKFKLESDGFPKDGISVGPIKLQAKASCEVAVKAEAGLKDQSGKPAGDTSERSAKVGGVNKNGIELELKQKFQKVGGFVPEVKGGAEWSPKSAKIGVAGAIETELGKWKLKPVIAEFNFVKTKVEPGKKPEVKVGVISLATEVTLPPIEQQIQSNKVSIEAKGKVTLEGSPDWQKVGKWALQQIGPRLAGLAAPAAIGVGAGAAAAGVLLGLIGLHLQGVKANDDARDIAFKAAKNAKDYCSGYAAGLLGTVGTGGAGAKGMADARAEVAGRNVPDALVGAHVAETLGSSEGEIVQKLWPTVRDRVSEQVQAAYRKEHPIISRLTSTTDKIDYYIRIFGERQDGG